MRKVKSINKSLDSFELFQKDFESYSVLEKEELYALIPLAQNGDKDVFDKIVNSNLRLVLSVAKTYVNKDWELQDLIQEGTIGLIEAVKKFDITTNNAFSTYAREYIIGYIKKALNEKTRMIRIPYNYHTKAMKYQSVKEELSSTLGKNPTYKDLASYLGVSVDTVKYFERVQYDAAKRYIINKDYEETEIISIVPDLNVDVEEEVLNRLRAEDIKTWLLNSKLSESQLQFIILYYGLFGYKPMSQIEIAALLGYHRKTVHAALKRAQEKLAKTAQEMGITDYLVDEVKRTRTVVRIIGS